MGRFFRIALIFIMLAALAGCGNSGGNSLDSSLPDSNNAGGETPATPQENVPGVVGSLIDLKDLIDPAGDHWYETRAAAINDAGTIIGQTNAGSPTLGAFSWNPATEVLTFLGIHYGSYDDYFGLKVKTPARFFIHSEAVDLNESGVIICNSTTGSPDEKRAFVWINGETSDLSPPPYLNDDGKWMVGAFSEAADVNSLGEVVLTAETRFGREAFYWDGRSFMTATLDIESDDENAEPQNREVVVPVLWGLGGIVDEDAAAVAINENGQAISNSGGTAVFTDLRQGVIDSLNYLPGATETKAIALNDSLPTAHVVGISGTRGFFWDGGAMYPINDLGGGASEATDINNLDQVVGSATLADGSSHAFLWTLGEDKKGHIRDLGTLGGTNSHAATINEAGQVVGWSETGDFYNEQGVTAPIRHAFLWQNGIMYDLGTHDHFYNYPFKPPFPFSEAVAINNGGQVAGNSTTINAHSRGFSLTPIFP
jgi:probable HAF family extracellular repeat protein